MSPLNHALALALLFGLGVPGAVPAQQEKEPPKKDAEQAATAEEELDRPKFHAAQSMMVQATVEAINHETREVKLKRADGEIIEFVASEEARNLDQVSVGDIVTAEYVESLSIEVIANEGHEPDAGEMAAIARTALRESPMRGGSTTIRSRLRGRFPIQLSAACARTSTLPTLFLRALARA